MSYEFHLFFSASNPIVTVRQTGFHESRDFPSLGEATRHLRQCMNGRGGLVVIHDDAGENRIPLPHEAEEAGALN